MDISGSFNENSQSEIGLVNRVALAVLKNIDPLASVGVVAFNYQAHEISELSVLSSKQQIIEEKIKKIKPFGSTSISQGILKPIQMLDNVSGDKYIVLISDGRETLGNINLGYNAAKEAVSKGIKILTVGVGEKVDNEVMRKIAEITKGEFFEEVNISKLKIFNTRQENGVSVITNRITPSQSTQTVFSSSCQLAFPMMEVLSCESADSFTKHLTIGAKDKVIDDDGHVAKGYWKTADYTCTSNCELVISASCTGWGSTIVGAVEVNGKKIKDLYTETGAFHNERLDTSVPLSESDDAHVYLRCDNSGFTIQASVKDHNKYLYSTNHDWSRHKLSETTNCIPQQRVRELISQQVAKGSIPQTYKQGGVDILGNKLIEAENFVDLSRFNINSAMKIGDTISYFYRWTVVPSINIVYDRIGNPAYCGGENFNRKIYSYTQVNTRDGSCYNVPSGQVKNVECCNDGDCAFKNQVCGPDFTCTNQKFCNSDLECGTVEASCNNKKQTSWNCDLSAPDITLPGGQNFKGICKQQIKTVLCCSNDCPRGYNCDPNQGCIEDIEWKACPPGQCCKPGGAYVPRSCPQGLQCCARDGVVGNCASTCVFEPITPHGTGIGGLDFSGLGENYCSGGQSFFGTISSFLGYFLPGASLFTSIFEPVNESLCENYDYSQQENEVQKQQKEKPAYEQGGFDFTTIMASLFS